MTETTAIAHQYIAAWNERDPGARRELVTATFAADADYVDPLMQGHGVDEIHAMIGAAQQQFPGHTFALHAGPDDHNDRLRFSWRLSSAGGDPVAGGTDFAVLAADGRIQSITGFLDAVE
jgi:hypothetical protein